MGRMIHRDLEPEELELYRDPSHAFTDPTLKMSFTDPETRMSLLMKGFPDRNDGYVRSWKLLESGMLIEIECKLIVLWDYYVGRSRLPGEEAEEDEDTPVPDFVYFLGLAPIEHYYNDPQVLSDYIHGFTERSIRLLNYEGWVAEYVRGNQKRVDDYLQDLLAKGNLRFYMRSGGNPKRFGPMAFLNVTDPENPKLLYPIYGMRTLLWKGQYGPEAPHAYIPWKPCQESSSSSKEEEEEEACGNPTKRPKLTE